MQAKIRGIYSTALSAIFLDAGWEIVLASDQINDRFSQEFVNSQPDVTIDSDGENLGIQLVGTPAAVNEAAAVIQMLDDSIYVWSESTPVDAIYEATVIRTGGSGAILNLDNEHEGYLPFDAVDQYIEVDDCVRVQIRTASPPWSLRRPEVAGELRLTSPILDLVWDPSGQEHRAPDQETQGIAELIPTKPRLEWTAHWHDIAREIEMGEMESAIITMNDLASTVDDRLQSTELDIEHGKIASPYEHAWCWLGARGRTIFDEVRGEVCPTIPNHHRIKAIGSEAGTAVDFVEKLAVDQVVEEVPFRVVGECFGPKMGDTIRIYHGKPDGIWISLGSGQVVGSENSAGIEVQRSMSGGGTYDALAVPIEDGDVARTNFVEGRRWYPTVYRDENGNRKGTYVNICTPIEIFPDAIRYIDLYVDVIKHADGRIERVDDDDLDAALDQDIVTEEEATQARSVAERIVAAIT